MAANLRAADVLHQLPADAGQLPLHYVTRLWHHRGCIEGLIMCHNGALVSHLRALHRVARGTPPHVRLFQLPVLIEQLFEFVRLLLWLVLRDRVLQVPIAQGFGGNFLRVDALEKRLPLVPQLVDLSCESLEVLLLIGHEFARVASVVVIDWGPPVTFRREAGCRHGWHAGDHKAFVSHW